MSHDLDLLEEDHTEFFKPLFKGTKKPVKTVKRSWAVKDAGKHLDKLSTTRIAFYVYRRHEMGILYTAVSLLFIWGIYKSI